MHYLLKNIKSLVQVRDEPVVTVSGAEMKALPTIENAFLIIKDGKYFSFGPMSDLPKQFSNQIHPAYEVIDASERLVLPCWCDSHTHLVFAAWREQEFADRIGGMTYEQIAERGGGILNSVKRLRDTSKDELYDAAYRRLQEMMANGTGALEIKSGYGLSLDSELKMLKVIRQLKESVNIPIKATLLAAHAIPNEYKLNRNEYIEVVINGIIPRVADEGLADYCDVFCEKNYFSKDETVRILEAAAKHNIKGKVHAEQLSHSGGIEAGVKVNARSVDHLEFATPDDIELLKTSDTIPTILPGAAFFLDLPRPPARKMIDAGLPVAIATDFNPGTSPSGNMNFMISLMCVQYGLTPAEAINAASINGAAAMDVQAGMILKGNKAGIIITKPIGSYNSIPYRFAENLIERVISN